MAAFDTLQVTTELVSAGIERNQAESIAKSIAKVQGDTVTKDYLDLRLSELELRITSAINRELTALKTDSQFTKWTITSALIKIAFFH